MGNLLGYQARAAVASRLIPKITKPSGTITTDSTKICNSFLNYYSNLYKSETDPLTWEGPNPLELLTYPQVDGTLFPSLGAPITLSEVQEMIKSLQNSKSPGLDGYTVEFYKAYSTCFAPILVRVFNDAYTKGCLPPTLWEASITLLFLKGSRSASLR